MNCTFASRGRLAIEHCVGHGLYIHGRLGANLAVGLQRSGCQLRAQFGERVSDIDLPTGNIV
jgi:hypothetical protein